MAGSSFGKLFHISTFGESHGKGVGVIVQGCPPGIAMNREILQEALDRRKPGTGSASTSRREPDIPEIMSGCFDGVTTGTPIMIMIKNRDADSRAYAKNADLFRPGHGDIAYQAKYGIRDWRGGGRASARETAARVAAGAAKTVTKPIPTGPKPLGPNGWNRRRLSRQNELCHPLRPVAHRAATSGARLFSDFSA